MILKMPSAWCVRVLADHLYGRTQVLCHSSVLYYFLHLNFTLLNKPSGLVFIPLDGSGAASTAEGSSLSTAFLTLLIFFLFLSGFSSFPSSVTDDAKPGLDTSFLFGLLDTRGWWLLFVHTAVAAVSFPINRCANILMSNLLTIRDRAAELWPTKSYQRSLKTEPRFNDFSICVT